MFVLDVTTPGQGRIAAHNRASSFRKRGFAKSNEVRTVSRTDDAGHPATAKSVGVPPHGPSSVDDHLDECRRLMKRAIHLAQQGRGRVEPNPMVGCVIARNDRLIGEGWHRRFAGPHAEIEALKACTGSPKGATAYVSLEPCCHVGKTPPCTDALIQAGIRRVVVALPDPRVHAGKNGVDLLRRAGIEVDIGTEATAAAELLAPYLTRACLHRPYVIAKWAQSLDGKLSTSSGDSRWISNESSRRFVHQVRARVDAILVGSRTVIADDPCLTARDVPLRRRAKRIVLDTHLRLPLGCRLVETAREIPTLIFTAAKCAESPKAKRLQARGVQVEPCRTKGGRISPKAVLSRLAQLEVTNLLVEGGPTILTTFFEAGVVDEAYVFTAPMLIGGRDAPSAIGGRGALTIARARRPLSMKSRRCGDDTLFVMRFTDPPLTRRERSRNLPKIR